MKVVCDTAPLVAALNKRDKAHRLASRLVKGLGRDLVVPIPVLVEIDYFLRARAGVSAARSLLGAVARGAHDVAYMTPGLVRRAVEIDQQYADLSLGLVDTAVMAVAERHGWPVLTFDFGDFRAAPPQSGYWELVVEEADYRAWTVR